MVMLELTCTRCGKPLVLHRRPVPAHVRCPNCNWRIDTGAADAAPVEPETTAPALESLLSPAKPATQAHPPQGPSLRELVTRPKVLWSIYAVLLVLCLAAYPLSELYRSRAAARLEAQAVASAERWLAAGNREGFDDVYRQLATMLAHPRAADRAALQKYLDRALAHRNALEAEAKRHSAEAAFAAGNHQQAEQLLTEYSLQRSENDSPSTATRLEQIRRQTTPEIEKIAPFIGRAAKAPESAEPAAAPAP
jgi:hypothetical protein